MNGLPLTPIGLLVGTLVAVFLMAGVDLPEIWGGALALGCTAVCFVADYARGRFR